MWSISTLEQVDWKNYLALGFNAFPEETAEELLENGFEQQELDEFRAGTKIMAAAGRRDIYIYNRVGA